MAKAVTFSGAATVGGLSAGLVLGSLGSLLPLEARVALASVLAVAAAALGAAEATGRVVPLLQCNSETPQRWLHAGALQWAVRNGLAVGFGATSRLGFGAWYVLPLGSLLLGSPALAALLYGCYGFVRGIAAWAWIVADVFVRPHCGGSFDDMAVRVLMLQRRARAVSGVYLLVLGSAGIVAVGL